MFGKRTQSVTPGGAAPRPAPAVPEPAAPTPKPGIQTEAFAFGFDQEDAALAPAAAPAEAPVGPAPSLQADRLDALAARPRPGAEAPQRPGGGEASRARGAGPRATPAFEQMKKVQTVTEIAREQPDYYHATKTTIFNALMNTIDLSQLAQLDQKAASEEIRDIVAELVAIKNVSMSVAEQEHLVQDIVNDVLGYGPLEPLLARDDIADIMVNGAGRVFIEVNARSS